MAVLRRWPVGVKYGTYRTYAILDDSDSFGMDQTVACVFEPPARSLILSSPAEGISTLP